MIEKIKEIFEKMNAGPVAILQTPNAGKLVDTGYGVDFNLAEYAVIYDNLENYHKNFKMKYDLEQKNNIEIMTFSSAGCSPSVDALIGELHEMDGFEIKWRRSDEIQPKEAGNEKAVF
jgi:hypothetical protein